MHTHTPKLMKAKENHSFYYLKAFLSAFLKFCQSCKNKVIKSLLLVYAIISLSHSPACNRLLRSCDPFPRQLGCSPIYICSCTQPHQVISPSSTKHSKSLLPLREILFSMPKETIWYLKGSQTLKTFKKDHHWMYCTVWSRRQKDQSRLSPIIVVFPYRVRFATTKQKGLPHKYRQLHTKVILRCETTSSVHWEALWCQRSCSFEM